MFEPQTVTLRWHDYDLMRKRIEELSRVENAEYTELELLRQQTPRLHEKIVTIADTPIFESEKRRRIIGFSCAGSRFVVKEMELPGVVTKVHDPARMIDEYVMLCASHYRIVDMFS